MNKDDNKFGTFSIVAVIAIVAMIGIMVLFPTNFGFSETGSDAGDGDTDSDVDTDTDITSTQEQDDADLRIIMLPYIVATDIEDNCVALNGTWHYDDDYTGCQGVPVSDCDNALAVTAMVQCLEVGAEWTCGDDGIYCKY
ncbi:MAG: hypothetical protein KAS04_01550 [Candidatus Aenigmarchaeota archaeon]|nr:hypothetical protein [Candidatus Aenigmarchaeota archaeon]